ncbi:NR0B2 protein, partial [Phainopepla nitens]|nr:NR0B2 protein [Phainopepla nitens]
CEGCQCHGKDRPPAILYTLLSQSLRPGGARRRCLCHQRRAVCLRTPHVTCQAAADVLVKTINFMRNVAAFHLLPREDQLLLLDSCWVPLFLLGLVQEMVTFEVMEAPAPSMLKKILLSGQSKGQEPEGTQPTLAAVQRLQWCLNSFWRLDLSPSEYTYLRGAILFNPGEAGLYIESLQREAQRALRELLRPEEQPRFCRILRVTSSCRAIPAALVTDLFSRPVIGAAAMGELLADMLFEGPGWPQGP